MGKRRESLLNFNAFVLRLFFVDLRLSQNPYIPTTDAQFSVREILKFATSFLKWQISRFEPLKSTHFSSEAYPKLRVSIPFSKTILLSSFALKATFTIFSVKM